MFGFFSKKKETEKELVQSKHAGADDVDSSELESDISMEDYELMLNDEQIKASVSFKKMAILSSGWEIVSPKNQDEDWEVTQFVKESLEVMDTSLHLFLERAMSAHDYGFSLTEKVMQKRDDGKIVYSNMLTRRPHDFEIKIHNDGSIKELTQDVDGEVQLNPDNFIHYAYNSSFGNPYGKSDLDAAYRAYEAKKEVYEWMSLFLKRHSIPPVFAYYNPDEYDAKFPAKMKKVLAKMQSASVGLLPRREKESLEILSTKAESQVVNAFTPALEMYDKHIAKSLLMPSLVDFTTSSGGSYAQSQTGLQMLMMIVDKIKTSDIERTIMAKQVIEPLVDLNFPGITEYPRFKFLPIRSPEMLNIIDRWTSLMLAGAVESTPEDAAHLRSLLGFPESDDDIKPTVTNNSRVKKEELKFAEDKDIKAARNEYKKSSKKIEKLMFEFADEQIKAAKNTAKKYRGSVKKISKLEINTDKFEKKLKKAISDTGEKGAADLNDIAKIKTKGKKRDGNNSVSKFSDHTFLKEAEDWLASAAFMAVQSFADPMKKALRDTMLLALQSGIDNKELDIKIASALNEFSKSGIKSSLARTIGQNATTGAYNQGRIIAGRSNDDIIGFVYQAIIDGNETEICSGLNGLRVPVDSPDLDTFAAPNHHNCRGLWSPIMFFEDKPEGMTSQQRKSAIENAGKGFV